MKLRNDDGDGIENVTIQMNLRFSKLSGCDLNVKYRWISLERNSWRPQASSNRQTIVVACIRSPWKIKRWLMKFHVAVVQLGVHLVEFLVLLRFTFPVPVRSRRRKHKKISRSRFTLEKNFESTRGHVYPLKSLFTCYDVCHVRKKLQYQNKNLLAKRVT